MINNNYRSSWISFPVNWFNTTVRSGDLTNFVMTPCCILISVVSVNISLVIFPLIYFVFQVFAINPSMNSVYESISSVFFQNFMTFSIFLPLPDNFYSFRNVTIWCWVFRTGTIFFSWISFATGTRTLIIGRLWCSFTTTLLNTIFSTLTSLALWTTTSTVISHTISISRLTGDLRTSFNSILWVTTIFTGVCMTIAIGAISFIIDLTYFDRRFDSEWATGIITTGSAAWVSADGPGKKDNSEDFLDTHLISMIGIFQPRIYDSLWLDFTLHSKSKMI